MKPAAAFQGRICGYQCKQNYAFIKLSEETSLAFLLWAGYSICSHICTTPPHAPQTLKGTDAENSTAVSKTAMESICIAYDIMKSFVCSASSIQALSHYLSQDKRPPL